MNFWNVLGNTVKVSRSVQRIVVSVAATTLISLALADVLKQRNKEVKRRNNCSLNRD